MSDDRNILEAQMYATAAYIIKRLYDTRIICISRDGLQITAEAFLEHFPDHKEEECDGWKHYSTIFEGVKVTACDKL